MKVSFILIILAMCLMLSTKAQKTEKKSIAPKEDVKVNREYDENGNLIKFDSIHSYSWSGDTTLLKSFSPEDFKKQFDNSFSFFSDSTFGGNSFFGNFDQMFAHPFGAEQDSVFLKKFNSDPNFHNFMFDSDSLALINNDFDEFFQNFNPKKGDSISTKLPTNLKSMEERMKILEKQMLEMEEYQRKFFNGQAKNK